MFSTDFILRQQENLVDTQKFQAAVQQNTIPILPSWTYEQHLDERNNLNISPIDKNCLELDVLQI